MWKHGTERYVCVGRSSPTRWIRCCAPCRRCLVSAPSTTSSNPTKNPETFLLFRAARTTPRPRQGGDRQDMKHGGLHATTGTKGQRAADDVRCVKSKSAGPAVHSRPWRDGRTRSVYGVLERSVRFLPTRLADAPRIVAIAILGSARRGPLGAPDRDISTRRSVHRTGRSAGAEEGRRQRRNDGRSADDSGGAPGRAHRGSRGILSKRAQLRQLL